MRGPSFLIVLLLCSTPSMAQEHSAGGPGSIVATDAPLSLPDGFDGAPPPQLPATVSRSDDGRVTVRAIRLTSPLRLDGNLDEELYRTITPVSGFIQNDPRNGEPASEKTEVWISFDVNNIYVSARLSETRPDRMVVNDMRRDSNSVFQSENFQFSLDTFHDRRNSVSFQFNPVGGRMDGQVANENQYSGDWNPVWRLEVRRQADGWTAEAAVPFKSLRYNAGPSQVWGIQLRRISRWRNETSFLTPLPAGLSSGGFQRASQYATLVGLEVPAGSRALDIKPYLISDLTTDLLASPQRRNNASGDFGFDVKYGVTQNVTADFTYNTDFAQVEVDEQQVNLTRFSLFFPEKREFFLENQGIFQFGGANSSNNTNNINNNSDTPIMFYSRRIGLEGGLPVPLEVGGRLTGRLGAYSIGVINIQTDDEERIGVPASNFTTARVRRDILRRSSIGALYTRRSNALNAVGDAELYGVDGRFAFFDNLAINTYWARSVLPDGGGDDTSYRGQVDYDSDRYGFQTERMAIGRDFDPQVGFMRREDTHKTRLMARFSPRPRNRFRSVRRFTYQSSLEYYTNSDDQFESRERRLVFVTEFQSSDELELNLVNARERLIAPFNVARGVAIPRGDYGHTYLRAAFQLGRQRPVSGTMALEAGQFYGGTQTSISFTSTRVRLTSLLSIEPVVTVNRVALPYGEFVNKLLSARTTYTLTPLMFISGLFQYNSANNSLGTNLRVRWEYQPGSELFLVYNDGRDTSLRGFPELQNRSFVVKVNRLFRF